MAAPLPEAEAQRLEVLRSLHILDTRPESAFDLLTLAVHKIAETEIALVSLVDKDRQWFKARFGLDGKETPRAWAFCAHAILGSDVFCVEDATLDSRFSDNPLVIAGPRIRSYAGAPIRVAGHNVGTVCAISAQPRRFEHDMLAQLTFVARAAAEHLELRKALAAKGDPPANDRLLAELQTASIDPELIEKGLVNMISLETIRLRMGERWTARSEGVWAYAHRVAYRELGAKGALVRLSDIHGIIDQRLCPPEFADKRAVRVLSEVFKFYLGHDAPAEVRVDRVTGAQSDRVTVGTTDGVADAAAAIAVEDRSGSNGDHEGPDETSAALSEHARWWRAAERTVECRAEPVWTVRTQAVVSFRLRPLVTFDRGGMAGRVVAVDPASYDGFTLSNLIGIDDIVLGEAARLLKAANTPLVLNVPIHHATLSSVTGRQLVTAALRELGSVAKSSIIICIVGLGDAAPQSRVAALAGLLKGQCRGVVVHVHSLRALVRRWRASGLLAFSVDLADLGLSERELAAQLPRFATEARATADGLIAYSVQSRSVMLSAWAAGFTHLSGNVVSLSEVGGLRPTVVEATQLWKAA